MWLGLIATETIEKAQVQKNWEFDKESCSWRALNYSNCPTLDPISVLLFIL